ncbi:unnamed protein product [Merluccius merluccius]
MDAIIVLKGIMIKRSQQKRRTSPCNYKERLFVLDTQSLSYFEQRPGKKPTLKGCIPLSRISCAEIVCTNIPIPCNNKYPFQVFHDNLHLYIFAPDNYCRLRWVGALKEGTKRLPRTPQSPNSAFPHLPGERLVVAIQDYSPIGQDDLPLHMDQEYIMIDSSCPDWWTVQDTMG